MGRRSATSGAVTTVATSQGAWGRLWRWPLRLLAWAVVLCAAIAVGYALFAIAWLPPLHRWHTERLGSEFRADRDAGIDFEAYLRLETRLFDEMRQRIAAWPDDDPAFADSRFRADGMAQRLSAGAPFNRSFRLVPQGPAIGQALLVHGLTDSPYAMRALAGVLQAQGVGVTVLRLPGHGTLPSMSTTMSVADWRAAVRIAAADAASRLRPGQPFYVGGFSTGGALTLLYTLDALEDPSLRRPTRVLLVAPAIELPKVATLTEIIDLLAVLPVPGLDKARWQEVLPEYDPYKYNSFSVNAAREVNRVTHLVQHDLAEAAERGRLVRMPPVVTWQSVVDSTVGASGAVETLYARLGAPRHRLVLFDVNHDPALRPVLREEPSERLRRWVAAPHGWTLDVVGNADAPDGPVRVTRLAPGAAAQVRDTALRWPADLVSVGHVALPFPADDPVYGIAPGSGHGGVPSIGSWLLRGESGATTVGLGALTRPRSNPFWPLIAADVAAVVAEDVAAGGAR